MVNLAEYFIVSVLLMGGLKMNSGNRNIRTMAGITILCIFFLAGNAGADPLPAILSIDGNEQTSGIGSNCWKVENETYSLCADSAGIVTPAEPLKTRSPFTAYLHMPFRNPLKRSISALIESQMMMS